MSDEKYLFKIQKDNEDSKIVETKTDMIFYNFNCRENFPISINYSNLNFVWNLRNALCFLAKKKRRANYGIV